MDNSGGVECFMLHHYQDCQYVIPKIPIIFAHFSQESHSLCRMKIFKSFPMWPLFFSYSGVNLSSLICIKEIRVPCENALLNFWQNLNYLSQIEKCVLRNACWVKMFKVLFFPLFSKAIHKTNYKPEKLENSRSQCISWAGKKDSV